MALTITGGSAASSRLRRGARWMRKLGHILDNHLDRHASRSEIERMEALDDAALARRSLTRSDVAGHVLRRHVWI